MPKKSLSPPQAQTVSQIEPFRRSTLIPRNVLLALLVVVLTSACGHLAQQINPSPDPAISPVQTSGQRVVQHAMGETLVPVHPQRVVTLDSHAFEAATALDVMPIGTSLDGVEEHLQDQIEEIKPIGGYPPNLEQVVALQPDLILGSAFLQEIYNQVSQIAPTVLAEFETSGDWKAVFAKFAESLGKTEISEQVMSQYDARLEQFKRQMGDRLEQTEVSVVRIYPNYVTLYAKDIFIGTILADAGLPRPAAQDQEIPTLDISKERLQDVDGDVIFVLIYGNNAQLQRSAEEAFHQLQNDPLWSTLKAVQAGRVYAVPNYWLGGGPLAANAVLDDLFNYLVEQ
jgi:iron complex transport system substrate-binding protein